MTERDAFASMQEASELLEIGFPEMVALERVMAYVAKVDPDTSAHDLTFKRVGCHCEPTASDDGESVENHDETCVEPYVWADRDHPARPHLVRLLVVSHADRMESLAQQGFGSELDADVRSLYAEAGVPIPKNALKATP